MVNLLMNRQERIGYLQSFKDEHKYTNRKLASLLGVSNQIVGEWLKDIYPIKDNMLIEIYLLKNYMETNKKEPPIVDLVR